MRTFQSFLCFPLLRINSGLRAILYHSGATKQCEFMNWFNCWSAISRNKPLLPSFNFRASICTFGKHYAIALSAFSQNTGMTIAYLSLSHCTSYRNDDKLPHPCIRFYIARNEFQLSISVQSHLTAKKTEISACHVNTHRFKTKVR